MVQIVDSVERLSPFHKSFGGMVDAQTLDTMIKERKRLSLHSPPNQTKNYLGKLMECDRISLPHNSMSLPLHGIAKTLK
jgi:hypothetical protein